MSLLPRRAPGRPADDVPVDDVERRAEQLARVVLHLTALADRYEQTDGRVLPLPPDTVVRVARLRAGASSGRAALADLLPEWPRGAAPAAAPVRRRRRAARDQPGAARTAGHDGH